MKCKKCGLGLVMRDRYYVCPNSECDWYSIGLLEEMVTAMDGSAAFEQYRESIRVASSVSRELSNDLVYLTDICRFLTGEFLERNAGMTANDADTINQIAQFVVAYDKR